MLRARACTAAWTSWSGQQHDAVSCIDPAEASADYWADYWADYRADYRADYCGERPDAD